MHGGKKNRVSDVTFSYTDIQVYFSRKPIRDRPRNPRLKLFPFRATGGWPWISAMNTPAPLIAYLLPALVGCLFALIGVGYRLGQARGVGTPTVVLYMALAGTVVFAVRSFGLPIGEVPARVWVLGIAAGLSQYATIKLCAAALERGPLSPLWCALNMVFVPVILYARVAFGETLSPLKIVGILVAIASVVSASKGQGSTDGKPGGGAVYFAILISATLGNAVLHGSIKDLGAHLTPDNIPLMTKFGDLFLLLLYASLGLPIAVELIVTRTRGVFAPAAIGTGAMAAFGSLAGFFLMGVCASYPAVLVSTLSAIFSLMGGSLASVLFFGERATKWWWIMMGLAATAVIMVSVPARP